MQSPILLCCCSQLAVTTAFIRPRSSINVEFVGVAMTRVTSSLELWKGHWNLVGFMYACV